MFLHQRFTSSSSSLPASHRQDQDGHLIREKGLKQKRNGPKIVHIILLVGVAIIGSYYLSHSSGGSSSRQQQPSIRQTKAIQKKPSIRQTKAIQNGLETSKWETFGGRQLKQYFGCEELFETPRPTISRRNWIYFRDLYNEYAARERSLPNNEDTTHKVNDDSVSFPVEGAVTADKGRGLIASRDIKRGELIFTGTNNTIVFDTGHSWRKFLWYLYHAPDTPDLYPEGFACDIRSWSWIQAVPNEEGLKIVVDIDESSLLNQPSEDEEANIQCGKLDDEDSICEFDYYAMVDIEKGDEILCEYADFAESRAWHELGL